MKVKFLSFLFLLSSSQLSFAENTGRIQLGASVEANSWTRTATGSTLGELKSGSGSLVLSAGYSQDKWYTGLSLKSGTYDTEPDENFPNDTVSVPVDSEVEIGGVDIIFGYYVWPRISIFTGLKSFTQEIGSDYSLEYSGLGLGVSGYRALNESLSGYWSLSATPLTIEGDGDELGSASGSALEFGAVKSLNDRSSFSVSFRFNSFDSKFDDGGPEVDNTIGGIKIGYHHQIER